MKPKEDWLDAMELRLKRACLDLADVNAAEGERFLIQEIKSHVEDIGGETLRREYLLSLRERFPAVFSNQHALSDEQIAQLSQPSAASPEIAPSEALDLVRRHWDDLDEAQKSAFLEACHLSPTRGGAGTRTLADRLEEPSDELARFLKLPSEAPVSSERLQEILLALLKTIAQVDALGTQVYKQLELSREITSADLRKLIGNYLTGDSAGSEQVHQSLDETRMKVGLIISSIANLPSALAQTHLAKFQPALIEQAAATSGGGGLLGGKEVKNWKKFVSLAEDLQPQRIEKAMNDLLSSNLRKLKRPS